MTSTCILLRSFQGLGLTSIDGAFFSTNTKLRYISMSRNSFTTIPSTLFDNLDSLAEVQLYETTLPCTCSELWFYGRVESTKMKVYGDIICSSPDSYLSMCFLLIVCAAISIKPSKLARIIQRVPI